jgi:uncharacterized protein YprB with RNaseH-like and TPR domain
MQIDPQDYLWMAEQTGQLAFWDIEATQLNADLGSVLCASVKPYGKKPYTFKIKAVGNDVKVVRDLAEALEEYHCWCTYYGKGFDVPFVNTRLLKWGYPPVSPRHHIDLFFTLKSNTKMSSKGLGRFASLLGAEDQQKLGVSQNVWSEMAFRVDKHMPTMVQRCESDCEVLEALYDKTKHIIKEIKRGGI